MGYARREGAASMRDRWASRQKEKARAAKSKGIPVPGTGVRHWHKRKSGSNKSGSLTKLNGEWSASGRKQEDDQRGINNRAKRQNIEDQLASNVEDYVGREYRPEEAWAEELDYVTGTDGRTYVAVDLDYERIWDEEGLDLWAEL